jgi:hypothetical protein
MVRSRSSRSQHTLLGGSHGSPGADGRPGNLLLVYRNRGAADRLRTRKRTLRDHRYGTLNIPVRVVHVGNVRGSIIDDRGVVDIGDGGGIHRGVADIHLIHVAAADLVRRHVDFARTQWEPSHIAAETHAHSASADEDYQCRRIHGPHVHRSGDPAPPAADDYPASVVEGGIAPG